MDAYHCGGKKFLFMKKTYRRRLKLSYLCLGCHTKAAAHLRSYVCTSPLNTSRYVARSRQRHPRSWTVYGHASTNCAWWVCSLDSWQPDSSAQTAHRSLGCRLPSGAVWLDIPPWPLAKKHLWIWDPCPRWLPLEVPSVGPHCPKAPRPTPSRTMSPYPELV